MTAVLANPLVTLLSEPAPPAARALSRLGWILRGVALLALLPLATITYAMGIELVLSEESGAYTEIAEGLAAELGRANLRRLSAAELEREGVYGRSPDIVIALGTRAFSTALALHSAPVVAAMVPAEAFERLTRRIVRQSTAKGVSGVFLDQPARRRLNLLRLTLPGKHRIGVLIGPDRKAELRPLRDAASGSGFSLVVEPVTSAAGLYPALSRMLAEAQVVLAIPDSAIYNSSSIHNILLATYRAQVPLLGFSPAYVQAGALLALYSTPRQIAGQVAELVQRAQAGRGLPPPQYPRSFTVGINPTVARSLDIDLEDGPAIERRLAALENEP